jgi:hypothetical protein
MLLRLSMERPATLEERCQLLEEVAELAVRRAVADIEADRDAFPCCVRCGEMAFWAVPGMPGRAGLPSDPMPSEQEEALAQARGVDDSEAYRDAHGGPAGLRLQCARQLCRTKRGHALELAIFACAAARVRDKPCQVIIDHDAWGNVHAYVQHDDGTIDNPQDDAASTEACGCGGAHA